jgi:ferrous iron transport protein A
MQPSPSSTVEGLLQELGVGQTARVSAVHDAHAGDGIARRLRELGFVPGEEVRVVALGPLGGEPILVQVGFTRFALRRAEARRVRVVAP